MAGRRMRPVGTDKTNREIDDVLPDAPSEVKAATVVDTFLAARLYIARMEAGLSGQGAAKALAVARTTYFRWERGVAQFPAAMLHHISRITGKPVGWFFEGLPGVLKYASEAEDVDGLITPESMQVLRLFALLDQGQQLGAIALMQGCVDGVLARHGLLEKEVENVEPR